MRALRTSAHVWMDVWVGEELLFQAHEKARAFRLRRAFGLRWRARVYARMRAAEARVRSVRHALGSRVLRVMSTWRHMAHEPARLRAAADAQWRACSRHYGLVRWSAAARDLSSAERVLDRIRRFMLGCRLVRSLRRCQMVAAALAWLRAKAAIHRGRVVP